MASLANIQLEYKLNLQDLAAQIEQITGANDVRDKAISEAIRWYSRRIPNVKTLLVASISSGFYPVPVDWADTSRIVYAEFPLDSNPPAYLTRRSIQIQRRDTGLFYYITPNPGGSYRLTYTTLHDATTPTSIPSEHEPIVGKMAAAIGLEEFASFFAKTVSNNLDSVNYRTKEQESRAVAKSLREQVDREMRLPESRALYGADSDALYPKVYRVY